MSDRERRWHRGFLAYVIELNTWKQIGKDTRHFIHSSWPSEPHLLKRIHVLGIQFLLLYGKSCTKSLLNEFSVYERRVWRQSTFRPKICLTVFTFAGFYNRNILFGERIVWLIFWQDAFFCPLSKESRVLLLKEKKLFYQVFLRSLLRAEA